MADYCVLEFRGSRFAIDLELLQEVIDPLPSSRVPLAPAGTVGLINLRGLLVPLMTLDRFVGIESSEAQIARRPWMAVFQVNGYAVAFLVEAVQTVRDAAIQKAEPQGGFGRFVCGAVSGSGQSIPVLSLFEIIQCMEVELATAAA